MRRGVIAVGFAAGIAAGIAAGGFAFAMGAGDLGRGPEITLRLHKTYASFSSVYAHAFSLAGGWMFEPSRAWQELALRGKDGAGVSAGAVFNLTPRIGMGFELDVSTVGLGGRNAPFRTHLEYPAIYGPEYVPRTVVQDGEASWPATQGELRIVQVLATARLRLPVRKNAAFTLAAGAGPALVASRFSALGFARYWMGGHQVLFSESYVLRMRTPAVWTISWTVELEYGLRLGPRLDLVVQAAGRGTGRISAAPEIEDVLDAASMQNADAPGADELAFAPLVLKPLYLKLGLGLRLRLGRGAGS